MDGWPLSKHCGPLIFRSTPNFHRQLPPTLFLTCQLSSHHRSFTSNRLPPLTSYFYLITPEFEYFWGVRVHPPPSTGGNRRIRSPIHPDVPAAGRLAMNHHITKLNITPSSPTTTTTTDDSVSGSISNSTMEGLLQETIIPSPSSNYVSPLRQTHPSRR